MGALSQVYELRVTGLIITTGPAGVLFEWISISSRTEKNITVFGCLFKISLSTWVSFFLFVLKAIKIVDPVKLQHLGLFM